MNRWGVFMLLAALLLPAGAARADTVAQLAGQAETPWRETVAAHGRELTFGVAAEVPDVAAMGLYRVSAASDEARNPAPEPEYPPKRRGIAQRSKPEETIPAEELGPDDRAFGNPLSAKEAVALAESWFAPRLAELPGVERTLESVVCGSPVYLFDKNAQQWLGTAVEGGVGSYRLNDAYAFMGAPLLSSSPFYVDFEAYADEGAYRDATPFWNAYAHVEGPEHHVFGFSLPRLEEALEGSVALAPLEAVTGTLRELARAGYLRSVERLTLGYRAFCVGERPQGDAPGEETDYLLMPVWAAYGEVYASPEEEARDFYGETWKNEQTILIDARTGAWLTRERVAGWE